MLRADNNLKSVIHNSAITMAEPKRLEGIAEQAFDPEGTD